MRTVFTSFVLAFSTLFGWTQEMTETPMANSLLWKIEGPGIKKGCYLFGTMHLIEKDKFYFPDKLKKLVEKSDVLVMELPGLPNQLEAMQYVTLKEGSFFDYFSPEQEDSLFAWAKKEMNMSPEKFRSTVEKMKPFVVVQMATQMHFIGKTESYEMTLDNLARANELEIAGLETVAEQMAIFDQLSAEQQTTMVMEGIRDIEKGLALTERMQQVYRSQNIDSLYLMIAEDGGVISEEQSDFLDDRNLKWIPKIVAFCQKNKTFIAVGAGHLGGPNGVIRLLRKEGFTVTPVEL